MRTMAMRHVAQPATCALALAAILLLIGFATPRHTLAACVDAGDPTCFVMTPTSGLPGATIAVTSVFPGQLDCPEPVRLAFYHPGEGPIDNSFPSTPLTPTGGPDAYTFVVPNIPPGSYLLEVECVSTRTSTSSPPTPFVVTGVPATSVEPSSDQPGWPTLLVTGAALLAGSIVLSGRPVRLRSTKR